MPLTSDPRRACYAPNLSPQESLLCTNNIIPWGLQNTETTSHTHSCSSSDSEQDDTNPMEFH